MCYFWNKKRNNFRFISPFSKISLVTFSSEKYFKTLFKYLNFLLSVVLFVCV
jgi:hypothetical protein